MAGDVDKLTDTLTNLRLEMVERLSKIETKLDRVEDHETRVRALEQARWRLAGAAAVLGTVGGAVVSQIMKVVFGG